MASTPKHIRGTTDTYDRIASRYLEANRKRGFEDEWIDRFAASMPSKSLVIDLGSGPGRDAIELRERGLHPICLDLSMGMLRAGLADYPCARVQADFRSIPIRTSSVAGVWANASLLHLAEIELADSIAEIARILVPGGPLWISLKKGEGSAWESNRFGLPRWFQYWSPDDLDRMLSAAGFRILDSIEREAAAETWIGRRCAARPGRRPTS